MKRIDQPRWKDPVYSHKEINDAGEIIRKPDATETERKCALIVIDNWRSAHAYPLHVFYMNLRRKAANKPEIVVAERLKRLDSIVSKLQREDSMNLYRMQDLGGCRMVLPTLTEVYEFSDALQSSKIRHELKRVKDYIKEPKKSGYRSLHLVYRFFSDTPGKKIYNKYNMLIEIQFRTHLQHIWATAVEAMGLFTNQALKAGQGDDYTKRFFVLVSSLFALREGCPVVPGTIDDSVELISEIEQIDNKYHILEMLRAINAIVAHDGNVVTGNNGYYILQLNYERHMLKRWYFKTSEIEKANTMYDFLESTKGDAPLDTVLVQASSSAAVKSAYPNYFMDIKEFVDIVTDYLR